MQNINKAKEFKNLLEKNSLSVVNFGASWCGPCKILAPQLDNLASQVSFNTIPFVKLMIDNDEFEEIIQDSKIIKVPTTIIYQGKTEIYRYIGTDETINNIKKILAQKLMETSNSDTF